MKNRNKLNTVVSSSVSMLVMVLLSVTSCSKKPELTKAPVYHVARLNDSMSVDANWDKSQWQNVKTIEISNYMGEIPGFQPVAQAKMMYNDENLYVIFHVHDRFVRCITKDFYGPVWEDAAVEFFFAPDSSLPMQYFNLEINCGGTPLMHYNIVPRKESHRVEPDDLKQVEIAHTLPQIIDPEITEPVIWTLEYRLPLAILNKYSQVSHPQKGVRWKANFYKIAENSTNPHYITWSFIDNKKPDFHLPKYFGMLVFD